MNAWTITWKDTLIRLRDRQALLFYLAAPLVLSFIMGAAFGGANDGGESPISNIPVIVVNGDSSDLGKGVAEALASIDLLAVTTMADVETAVAQVEAGEATAVIHIPANFGDITEPTGFGGFAAEETTIELFMDPTSTISPLIVRSIVNQLANGFNSGVIGSQLFIDQLLQNPAVFAELGASGTDIETALESELEGLQNDGTSVQIELNSVPVVSNGTENEFDFLAFFAPSMAIFFVMFSVIDGSRSLLDEKLAGTLDRLISTPTSSLEIILGKVGGTFLTGVVQLSVLILFSLLFFGLRWGESPLALIFMILVTVASATSLGILIAGFVRNPSQVSIIGTAVVLVFAALGGNFIPAVVYPEWMLTFSRFTLNYWALEGFSDLTLRGLGFADILLEGSILLTITVVFLGLGVWRFQQQMAR